MPSAEGTNRRARCMQPPRAEQPALTYCLQSKPFSLTWKPLLLFFCVLYLVTKIEGRFLLLLLVLFLFKKKLFLLLLLYALPYFSVLGEVGGKESLKNPEGGNFF